MKVIVILKGEPDSMNERRTFAAVARDEESAIEWVTKRHPAAKAKDIEHLLKYGWYLLQEEYVN